MMNLDRRTQAILLALAGVVAAGGALLLPTLPFGLTLRESVVLAGIFFALAVFEVVIDDTSF
jgi:hypothetical protein